MSAFQLASFVNADLTGAVLTGGGSSFQGSTFEGSKLVGARLLCSGASFQAVDVTGANFRGADISTLEAESLKSCYFQSPPRYDGKTKFPVGFDPVDEDMEVVCCVGPELSWSVLSSFIATAKGRLVSSMYEFHAKHVADAIEKELDDGASLQLVLATQSRDPKKGEVGSGQFPTMTRLIREIVD